MGYKAGSDRKQKTMMPDVMDDYVAEDNPVRVIDAFVESLNIKELGINAEPAETGRPAYNPKDMLKLFMYGYFNRLRSSRRLETETKRNIELMWLLCTLSPDHKTIARFRKENAKALKNVFRKFVKLCQKLGLYGNELLAIDGSKFKAVNSLDNNYNDEKLDDRLRRIDEKLELYLSELAENDEAEGEVPKHSKEEIAAMITELSAKKQTYESMKARLAETGETQISTTDPEARRMKLANGASDVCYNVQTAVDSKHKLIADYEVTDSCNDKNLLAPIAKSAKELLDVDEIAVVADNGYFVASDIAGCILGGIIPHVSSEHDSYTFCVPAVAEEVNTPQGFGNIGKNIYVRERNIGLCPMGVVLYPRSYRKSKNSAIYSNSKACKNCQRREQCKPYDRELQVKMHPSEFSKSYNDEGLHIRQFTYSPDKELMRKRKTLVEHPFGTVKRSMDAAYCLLKGRSNVCGEFALTFLAYNLKRVINIVGVAALLDAISPARCLVRHFSFPRSVLPTFLRFCVLF